MREIEEPATEDITAHFDDALRADRRGPNVLILRRLEEPRRPFNGKLSSLELEYRWLSVDTCSQDDLVRVAGNEFTLWQESDLDTTRDLFSQVNLF